MNYKIISLCLICIFSLSGCASLFNGSQQDVTIKTQKDAEIFINGRYAGTGYTVKSLPRDEQHEIKVVNKGCEESLLTQPRFNKISLMGLFMDLGLMSIPTDFISGAAWNIYPNKVQLDATCTEDNS